MRNKRLIRTMVAALLSVVLSGCSLRAANNTNHAEKDTAEEKGKNQEQLVKLSSGISKLESGFSAVHFEGDDGFEEFLSRGGASSDRDVVEFLSEQLMADVKLDTKGGFGCSTLSVADEHGNRIFGRNFDWDTCNALVIVSKLDQGYASIATANTDFITASAGTLIKLALKKDELMTRTALYAPLDGMNEKGFAVSVNMISDGETIEQNSKKPDITTTTAVRLLLNRAGNVEEALQLLESYDLHASMGMMIHFAMTDTTGRSVVVEYINDEMHVIETPIVTNFYLTEGEKYGIGTAQSHERFEKLEDTLKKTAQMDRVAVRDALDSVSKDNYDEYESTEWSVVFRLSEGKADYYHRENYKTGYTFSLE